MKFNNFNEAYIYNLNEVYNNPQFINMPRGNKSKERLNCSFVIQNPIERVCYMPSRKTNIIFNFAEALWYLSSSNRLNYIGYYASNMNKYSNDGKKLVGTAYGPKIFAFGKNKINQWQRVINILREDRDSKRAFISIFDPNEDLSLRNIDVSCTIGFQFFNRNGSLYMTTFMRANDSYRGIVSDVFSFTFLQEFLANQMNLSIGEYCHNVATVHVYEPDNSLVERVLSKKENCKNSFTFPLMPKKDNWCDLKEVLKYERALRERTITLTKNDIDRIDLEEYWKQVITLFALYQGIHYYNEVNIELFKRLFPIYQFFVKCRWHELIQEVC